MRLEVKLLHTPTACVQQCSARCAGRSRCLKPRASRSVPSFAACFAVAQCFAVGDATQFTAKQQFRTRLAPLVATRRPSLGSPRASLGTQQPAFGTRRLALGTRLSSPLVTRHSSPGAPPPRSTPMPCSTLEQMSNFVKRQFIMLLKVR